MIRDLKSPKLRAVEAKWRDEAQTATISFYFHGKATEEELEDFSVACTEIIAHIPNSLLDERFIRLDYPTPLPSEVFLAYKRKEL